MKSNEKAPLTTSLILLLSITCGVVVANMYYIQSIETRVATSLSVSTSAIGISTMLTQSDYALGLLLSVPLGDVVDRPRLVIRTVALFAVSLSAAFFTLSFTLFAYVSFLIGLLSIVPQIAIPYGAVLAGPKVRGKVMGTLPSGLLARILLSRTVPGIVVSPFSRRMIYLSVLCAVGILTLLLYQKTPRSVQQSSTAVSHFDLLKSSPHSVASQRLLREAAASGLLMLGTFSTLQFTLTSYISSPVYSWGTFEAGILAISGLSGAVAAPVVGRLADSHSERKTVYMGLVMQTISLTALLVGGGHLAILFLVIILLDVGNQLGQVAN